MKTKMKFDLTDEFDLPTENQSASPLMRLPVEIRLRILRLLLVHDEHLTGIADGCHCEHHCFDLPVLSSQVLAVCQILYYEVIPILYRENIVNVNLICSFLEPWESEIRVLDNINLFNDGSLGPWHYVNLSEIESYESARGLAIRSTSVSLNILERFTNIHIDCETHNENMFASRVLKDYVKDKWITVRLLNCYRHDPSDEGGCDRVRKILACFSLWKCTSIKFQVRYKCVDCLEHTRNLETSIMKGTYVHDLVPNLVQLKDVLENVPETMKYIECDDPEIEAMLDNLNVAVQTNDIETFKRLTRPMLEEAKLSWLRDIAADIRDLEKDALERATKVCRETHNHKEAGLPCFQEFMDNEIFWINDDYDELIQEIDELLNLEPKPVA